MEQMWFLIELFLNHVSHLDIEGKRIIGDKRQEGVFYRRSEVGGGVLSGIGGVKG